MIILKILYGLIIEPIYILFEFVFSRAYRMINTNNAEGLAIIVLSLTVNLLILPLYRRADKIQNEERDKVARLKPGVDHIKKAFRGDERFMMLQTYYRQNDYSPILALRSSLSIILEIPFFLAAYSFLSDLAVLQNKSFGPIENLGKADQLIRIGGLSINLLPILMTVFNIVSGLIYTKGLPLKNKIQFVGIAIIFLVLLYTSPAGLVFYWTLNNLFSLCKNLIDRQKNPKLIAFILCSIAGAGMFLLGSITFASDFGPEKVFMMWLGLLAQIPIGLYYYRKKKGEKPSKVKSQIQDQGVFFLSGVVITILVGTLIPSMVIKASPSEFVDLTDFHTSFRYVGYTAVIAAGLFLLWFTVFFKMAKESGRTVFSYLMFLLAGTAVVNTMVFRGKYGNISSYLKYDKANLTPSLGELGINTLVNILVAGALFLLLRKSVKLVKRMLLVVCMALIILTASNMRSIYRDEQETKEKIQSYVSDEEGLSVPLSRNENNVVVIMLDRAISIYYPFIINENPKLKEQLAGFTFYPNTISYGPHTNLGTPALFGGYEYTPEEMNRRDTESLADKHTEALKVMPVLFDEAGFDVNVLDPVYAGYHWIPDLSVFDDHPTIKKAISKGIYTEQWCIDNGYDLSAATETTRQHNFFMYSLLRAAPVLANDLVYDAGKYNKMDTATERKNCIGEQDKINMSLASGISRAFLDPYANLCYMSDMTPVKESDKGTFLVMTNDATHDPMLLQEPDYSVYGAVDNQEFDKEHAVRYDADGNTLVLSSIPQMEHYHANMAALMALGEWFDYLRAEGAYDNTRIILVSDHGRNLGISKYQMGDAIYEDLLYYNALLLVKDFGDTELKTDYRFMTNADTSLLAMEGIIEEPRNPFTGNLMTDEMKQQPEQHVAFSGVWSVSMSDGNQFKSITWLAVQNNALDVKAWRVMGESR